MLDPTLAYRNPAANWFGDTGFTGIPPAPAPGVPPVAPGPPMPPAAPPGPDYASMQQAAFQQYMNGARQAFSHPAPTRPPMKFGTQDLLLGLLPALFMGKNAPGWIGNYLGGKMQGADQKYQDSVQRDQMESQRQQQLAGLDLTQSNFYGTLDAQQKAEAMRKAGLLDDRKKMFLMQAQKLESVLKDVSKADIPALADRITKAYQAAGMPELAPAKEDVTAWIAEADRRGKEITDQKERDRVSRMIPSLLTAVRSESGTPENRLFAAHTLQGIAATHSDLLPIFGSSPDEVQKWMDALGKKTPKEKGQDLSNEQKQQAIDAKALVLNYLPEELKLKLAKDQKTNAAMDQKFQTAAIVLKHADEKERAQIAHVWESVNHLKRAPSATGSREDRIALSTYGSAVSKAISAIRAKHPDPFGHPQDPPQGTQDWSDITNLRDEYSGVVTKLGEIAKGGSKAATGTSVSSGQKVLGQTVKPGEEPIFEEAMRFYNLPGADQKGILRHLVDVLRKRRGN